MKGKDRLFKNLRRRTKFLILNEPIVHLTFGERIFHSLLFDLEVDHNVYTLDENLMNFQNGNHSNVLRLLVDIYKEIEKSREGGTGKTPAEQTPAEQTPAEQTPAGKEPSEGIRYIFLGTAYTRIHPLNLELLLRKLNKYIYNEEVYKKGNIDIAGILSEYSKEVEVKRLQKERVRLSRGSRSSGNGHADYNFANEDVERMAQEEKSFFLNAGSDSDGSGSDKYILKEENGLQKKVVRDVIGNQDIQGSKYKGLFVGFGLAGEGEGEGKGEGIMYPAINSGVIIDITLLRHIYEKSLVETPTGDEQSVRGDHMYELSKYISDRVHVQLTPFENTCLNEEKNTHLMDNEVSVLDAYKYHQVLRLFNDYSVDEHAEEDSRTFQTLHISQIDKTRQSGQSGQTTQGSLFSEGDHHSDDSLADMLLGYFNLVYPVSTCVSHSVRGKNESFVGYDKFHLISIENDIKLKSYIRETEDIEFNSIDEYKMKLSKINKKYDHLLETENQVTHKNMLIAVKTSVKTEDVMIPYIKNTYDNEKNNEKVFNALRYESKLKEKGINIFNDKFLKSAFDTENIDLEVIYMSDGENSNHDTLHFSVDDISKKGSCERLKHMFYYFYEEYINKDTPKMYFFISNDDTFVNVKNLVDVMNLTLNGCIHSKKYMYQIYKKSVHFMIENESSFLHNFSNKKLSLYTYIKRKYTDMVNMLKKYDYVPSFCRNGSKVPIYLGKRHSYDYFFGKNEKKKEKNSFDHYISGRAGILVNDEFVKKMYTCDICTCPEENIDVDIILGKWAKKMNVVPINFEGFFENNPKYYNKIYLYNLVPITYGKLNEGKTVQEAKQSYFEHMVNYKKKRNNSEPDALVDYLDRNHKNIFDNLFHYFFYISTMSFNSWDNNITKINSKIYSKMESSKKYKQLFDVRKFFKQEIEETMNIRGRYTRAGGKKKKTTYANNYVRADQPHVGGALHELPVDNLDNLDNVGDVGETDEVNADDEEEQEEADEEEQFDEDYYDYDEYLGEVQVHREKHCKGKWDSKDEVTPNEDYNDEL
ncbi:TVN-junction protein 1, putative [Plasmodium ovale]|uniref:TVN-junction protein 1, putative n=1 Tax=Plasmodium ovale TaxID=36330 RepID=A0A1C3KRV0_PLAOA|nr:TVN-junction protein 1, putative [Plasmodium ovale]